MKKETINKSVLLTLVAGISLLFLSMIQPFLLAIFMAALFAAMTRPVYLLLVDWLRGRRYLASFANLFLLLIVVLIPVSVLLGIFIAQAVNVGETVAPLVVTTLKEPGTFSDLLEQVPLYQYLAPYTDHITARTAESVEAIGKFLVGGVSTLALGTANFVFMTLVFFYTLFFFQIDGPKVVERILYYLPMNDHDERRMLERFTSVTRAMIKGTLLIGLLQGTLAGLAFGVAGVGNAVFWGIVMAVLSIVPGIGSAVVWVPASIILIVQGHVVAGVGLMLFCGLVVGSVDNVLRPMLVGKDVNMHELMIFFGTLGGLFMFGMAGLLIGPLVASLFLTIWDIYGIAFKDMLPAVGPHPELRMGKRADRAGEGGVEDERSSVEPAPEHDEELADWRPEDEPTIDRKHSRS
jgi:predicted PurR-regulated permease PerM